jgi:RNA polymerase sigma-70 factor (sigma-E family)
VVPLETESAIVGPRPERIAELYSLHIPAAGRLAYVLVGDRELASDITQEAFLRSVSRLGALRREAAFDRYLRRSVVNLTRKHWRKKAAERSFVRRFAHESSRQFEEIPDIATRDELWRALLLLPYEQRAAIVLRFFEDLSERDAAAALGCPQGTLKSRVSRGLAALRIEIRGDDHGSN